MTSALSYLEGKRFCVVFVKVLDHQRERVQLHCFRGRASIERGHLHVVNDDGAVFAVPGSALPNVMPSDGSTLLGDADYFVLVKADDQVVFSSMN